MLCAGVHPLAGGRADAEGRAAVLMPDSFRFSPNPNRAAEIEWRAWNDAAFAEAAESDRVVLLNLTSVWCRWCQIMDETTYSDPGVIALINGSFIAVRVDADRYPHVQDRYIAGGWPTNAFLTPTGEVLWAGTYTEADQLQQVAHSVLAAWRERRTELELEMERRRRAIQAARGRSAASGLVRREHAEDVLGAVRGACDAHNGGFGEAPKFPQPEAVELLYAQMRHDAACGVMADQSLDGMLAGELWDAVDGGFFRYATAADWTAPCYEKLLDVNAALLDAYALGAAVRGRDDWRDIAGAIVAWADATLRRSDGLWGGSQSADPEYFAADQQRRAALRRPPVDETIYTSWNARWIAALALAGARLQRDDWVVSAEAGLDRLLAVMAAPNGGVYHFRGVDGEPQLDFLLADTAECVRAAVAVAQATGAGRWLESARSLARHMESAYWAEDGAFWDRIGTRHDIGALRYRDRPFELNALVARTLLDLAHVTGERNWRALAERTLAAIGAQAGRYGTAGAVFALATGEFFEAPPAVFIALPAGGGSPAAALAEAAALRRAAFSLAQPSLRVWTVPSGHSTGPQRFEAAGRPTGYVWTLRGCSAPITVPDQLAVAGAGVLRHA
jgi:uncharacterized protein